MASKLPRCTLLHEAHGRATYQVPMDEDVRLSELFVTMETLPHAEWALRQTSMEEVFLEIALAAEDERDKGDEKARGLAATVDTTRGRQVVPDNGAGELVELTPVTRP